jgi:hypothetical protein
MSVGFMEEGRLDQTQASLDGGDHRWRVKIQDLESLGLNLRWLHPNLRDGCLFQLLLKPLGDGASLDLDCARHLCR